MSRHDFDEFVAAGTDELLRTAYLIVWGLPEAEDLVQESLFKVAKRWPRVRRMDRPRAYARRMLVNLALGGRDKRMRRRAELEATAVEPAAAAPAEPHDELRAALEALLPRQRAVLVLRYFLDLPRVRGRGCARLLARNGEEHRVACARAARERP